MQAHALSWAGERATTARAQTADDDAPPERLRAERIVRVSRVVGDLDRAQEFYHQTLDFRALARDVVDPAQLFALGVRGVAARQVVMQLGAEEIALVQFDAPGRPYPEHSRSNDLWFEHLAIVVEDMDAAYAQLLRGSGWSPISSGGPQTLPATSGGVRAFKFRDPDGHPLELLWFPPGADANRWRPGSLSVHSPFLGIDHTALAVRSTRSSLAFYRTLGMRLAHRSLNRGTAQSNLDAIPAARVRVTRLRPQLDEGPGVELLAYRPPGRSLAPVRAPMDRSTDWVTLAFGAPAGYDSGPGRAARGPRRPPVALQDPDGHRLLLVDQSGERGSPA